VSLPLQFRYVFVVPRTLSRLIVHTVPFVDFPLSSPQSPPPSGFLINNVHLRLALEGIPGRRWIFPQSLSPLDCHISFSPIPSSLSITPSSDSSLSFFLSIPSAFFVGIGFFPLPFPGVTYHFFFLQSRFFPFSVFSLVLPPLGITPSPSFSSLEYTYDFLTYPFFLHFSPRPTIFFSYIASRFYPSLFLLFPPQAFLIQPKKFFWPYVLP